MPDETGKLSQAEIEAAVDWINNKAASPIDACPVCGSEDNYVNGNLARIPLGYRKAGLTVIPTVVTVCANCGFTRQFNALKMGIAAVGDDGKLKATDTDTDTRDGAATK